MDISAMSKRYSSSNITTNDTNKTESLYDFYTAGWIFNLIAVLPENSYVIWLIVTGAGNGVASEFFSLNLSVCEIFLCLQSFLCLLGRSFPGISTFVEFLTGVSMIGRPLFQCLICVECYLAVMHPFTFLKFKPLRYRLICSNAVWLVIVIACVFACVDVSQNQFYFFVCFSLSQALLCLSVKLFCCLAVLRALKQSGPGEKGKYIAKDNLVKRRAFNIIVLIIMATVVMYSAYLVAAAIFVLTHKFISKAWIVGHVCFVLGGMVQPLLYLNRTGKLAFCKVP